MPATQNIVGLIATATTEVNEKLTSGLRLRYWGPEGWDGKLHRVEKWDAAGPVEMLAVGTAKEVLQYVLGYRDALVTVGR